MASPVDLAEACFSVPAVRALRSIHPQSTMVVLCPERLAPLWRTVVEPNNVVVYPDKASVRQIERVLRECEVEFESSIVWGVSEVAKAFTRMGILQRLGYPAKGVKKNLTEFVEVVTSPGPIEHRVKHYLRLVDKLGGTSMVRENFQTLPLKPAPKIPRIVLAPASEYGEAFNWPVERFKEVVDALLEVHGEVEPIVAVLDDDPVCVRLASLLDCEVVSGEGKVLDVLPHCSALLGCDGEVAHLAAHVGLPAVVIFGPNEPEWKRPLGKQSRLVREHVACSPCFLTKCPLDLRCQNEVGVERVVSELEGALAGR